MVVKNKFSFFIFLILFVVGLAWLVMAATGDGILVESPASGTNHSGAISGSTIFNVSFINGSVASADIFNGSSNLNATFYYNLSATNWVAVGNSSHCVSFVGSGLTNVSCAGTLNASQFANGSIVPDGYYNVNVTIYNGSAANVLLHGAHLGNTTLILIDNTEPLNVNITSPTSSTNHSGNLTLNVSVADSLSGVGSVIFNIMNATSGVVNRTVSASREGSSSYWSASINTSHYLDESFNISIFVNDTVGNFNASANDSASPISSRVLFDNTAPSISHSCDDTNVNTGETITCSCSGSALSGIQGTSFTTNPSTASSGTFSTSCTVTSHSGLSTSSSISYEVQESTSTSGSGSSSPTWKLTLTENDKELSTKGIVSRSLEAKTRVSVLIDGRTYYVGAKSVGSSSATLEISGSSQEVSFSSGEKRKFEVNDDGFYDLEITLDSITAGKANLFIRSVHEEVSNAINPEVSSIDGKEENELSPESGKGMGTIWMIVILILVALAAVAFVWYSKNKRRAKMGLGSFFDRLKP